MGRIDTNEVQYHQGLQFEELHQTPPETIDDAPPNEEDLYEPPPTDYQPDRPPPPPPPHAEVHSFPPPNHEPPPPPPPPQAFPPPYDSYPEKPQAFPPPQEETFSPIIGHHYQQQQQQQQQNVGMQTNYQVHQGQVVGGVPVGASPSPSPLLQQQQYQPPTQPWRTQLFDCMDDPQNAVITLFFPCVTFGQIAEIMDSGNTPCGTSGMLYTLIACCIAMPCILSCTYRSKMRSKFGLIESPAPDWLVHCFCECCALCQEYRELQERGFDPSIGWLGNVAKQQQKQQQFGMTPPMQQRMM